MSNGALAVFSPTALTTPVRSTLESLGNNVRYIAAPDIEHHIYLSQWAKAFPSASILAVEGLPEKREKNPETKGTRFSHVWTEANKGGMRVDDDFDRDFDVEYVGAHANKELVVNYKPDRTLIEADLIFHLPATEQYSRTGESASAGIFTKMFTYVMNTRGNALTQKRFLWYIASKPDRRSFAESMKRINGWDFDRIIPCHGDVIETDGKGVFQKVMAWHLQNKST